MVATCVEKLDISGILLTVMQMSGKCQGKILSWNVAKVFIVSLRIFINYRFSNWICCGWHWFLCFYCYEVIVNLIVWSLTLTLVVHAWYEYRLTWAGVLCIVRWFHSVCRVVTKNKFSAHSILFWSIPVTENLFLAVYFCDCWHLFANLFILLLR